MGKAIEPCWVGCSVLLALNLHKLIRLYVFCYVFRYMANYHRDIPLREKKI